MKRTCKQCGEEFILSRSEVAFYKERKLTLPRRCKKCREQKKQQGDSTEEKAGINAEGNADKDMTPEQETKEQKILKYDEKHKRETSNQEKTKPRNSGKSEIKSGDKKEKSPQESNKDGAKPKNGKKPSQGKEKSSPEEKILKYENKSKNMDKSNQNKNDKGQPTGTSENRPQNTANLNQENKRKEQNLPKQEKQAEKGQPSKNENKSNESIKTKEQQTEHKSPETTQEINPAQPKENVKSKGKKLYAIIALILCLFGGASGIGALQSENTTLQQEADATIQDNEIIDDIQGEDIQQNTQLENDTITENSSVAVTNEAEVEETVLETQQYVFRNENLLKNHYEKHGIEMGFEDAKSYEAAASAVVNNPNALKKLEKDDNDGDYVYYVEETNEFVILSADGYLRTYYYPEGGMDYFNRQ